MGPFSKEAMTTFYHKMLYSMLRVWYQHDIRLSVTLVDSDHMVQQKEIGKQEAFEKCWAHSLL